MKIEIDKTKTINSIQEEFRKKFPGLKIEFYTQGHSQEEVTTQANTLNRNSTIEQLQKEHQFTDTIIIDELMKVGELEHALNTKFGLSAQVFRKSGELWLQTTTTDNWTLAKQNEVAMEKTDASEDPIPDPLDRQELE
jgi:hypothetical protein